MNFNSSAAAVILFILGKRCIYNFEGLEVKVKSAKKAYFVKVDVKVWNLTFLPYIVVHWPCAISFWRMIIFLIPKKGYCNDQYGLKLNSAWKMCSSIVSYVKVAQKWCKLKISPIPRFFWVDIQFLHFFIVHGEKILGNAQLSWSSWQVWQVFSNIKLIGG